MSLFKIAVSVLAVGASAQASCKTDADCTDVKENNKCLEVYGLNGSKQKTCTNAAAAKLANDTAVETFFKNFPAADCGTMFVAMQVPKTQADCVCKSDAFRKCTVPEVLNVNSAAEGTAEQQDAASTKFGAEMAKCLCTHARSCDTDKPSNCPALPSDAPVAGTILAGAVAAAAYMA